MYYLRGENESGDRVELLADTCWRCGALVNLTILSVDEHVERMHPPAPGDGPRHALNDERRPPDLSRRSGLG